MNRATVVFVLLATACSKQPSEAAPPQVTEAAPPRPEKPAPAEPAPAPPDPEPVADVDAGAAPPVAEPPPNVKVISIGMHVAGGPYDEETKKPFLKAVEPRYAELAQCWKHVADPTQADVGVDLVIPASGGHAKVSNPRATIRGEGFLPCVVAFFETIDFEKPSRGGPQGLSYSVRFKP